MSSANHVDQNGELKCEHCPISAAKDSRFLGIPCVNGTAQAVVCSHIPRGGPRSVIPLLMANSSIAVHHQRNIHTVPYITSYDLPLVSPTPKPPRLARFASDATAIKMESCDFRVSTCGCLTKPAKCLAGGYPAIVTLADCQACTI